MKFTHRFLRKRKLIKSYERSVLQIQSILAKKDKRALKTFKFNEKIHSTMKKNICTALCRRFAFFNYKS